MPKKDYFLVWISHILGSVIFLTVYNVGFSGVTVMGMCPLLRERFETDESEKSKIKI